MPCVLILWGFLSGEPTRSFINQHTVSILDTSQSKTLIAVANRVNSSRKPTNQQVTCSVRAGREESCEELVGVKCCSQHLLWQYSEVRAPDCSRMTGQLACLENLTRWSSVTQAYFWHTITRTVYLSKKLHYQHPCALVVHADHSGHRKLWMVTLL